MSRDNNISSIAYKLKQTQHMLRLKMDDTLRSISLTTPQYAVLSQLELKPGISNASLARASFITPQTMHAIILNLEKNGFLKRKKSPNHGRIIYTELTKKGYKILDQAHQMVSQAEAEMLHNIPKKEQSLLDQILSNCMNNMK